MRAPPRPLRLHISIRDGLTLARVGVDERVNRLTRGARFLTEPVDHAAEVRAFLRDPDGHLFEISEAKA